MGAVIVLLLAISSVGLWYFLTLPATAVISGSAGLVIMAFTVVFFMSVAALIIWTDSVREFYQHKRGIIPLIIKIVTFPIWLFGILFCAWGVYSHAKNVRNWMHKDN